MEIQEILGYLLNSSAKMIKRTMDSYLDKYGITTSQWAILKLLDNKIQLTQTQIAKELLGDRATAGDVIQRLCEKGYIEKSLDKYDRRVYVVSLTPKAKNVIVDIEGMVSVVTKKALEGLTESEEQILYKSLKHIINNLSQEVSYDVGTRDI